MQIFLLDPYGTAWTRYLNASTAWAWLLHGGKASSLCIASDSKGAADCSRVLATEQWRLDSEAACPAAACQSLQHFRRIYLLPRGIRLFTHKASLSFTAPCSICTTFCYLRTPSSNFGCFCQCMAQLVLVPSWLWRQGCRSHRGTVP